MHFLRGLRLSNQHLAGWNKTANDFQFRVVQMKCLPVNLAIHFRIGEKDFCGTALRHYRQHPRFLKLFDRLRRQDHGGVVFTPSLLRLHYIVADRLVLDEQPCLIKEESLEGGESSRVGNFVGRAMQNVKQQRLQNFRRVVPAMEVERLKARERKRVFSVVKQEPVLPAAGPAVEAFFQLADDVPKIRNRALVRLQYVDALDRVPQSAFLLEVEPVTLLVALNEHAEEAEEKLQVLFGLRQ